MKIVLVTDPLDVGHLKLDLLQSLNATDPAGFEKVRQQAKDVVSLSNLRQLGLAMIIYAETHDGHLPDADKWVDSILPGWKKDTEPNASNFDPLPLFHDPASPAGQQWNYAFNRNLSGIKLSDIHDPAVTVMLFESTTGLKNAADTGQSLPHPGRHAGGDYYVFADGRAKWFPDGTNLSYLLSGK